MTLRRDSVVHGGYPPERPASEIFAKPSPFTGQLMAYRLDDDGSLVLELEGARELLAERWGGRSWKQNKESRNRVHRQLQDKVFAVRLPPGNLDIARRPLELVGEAGEEAALTRGPA